MHSRNGHELGGPGGAVHHLIGGRQPPFLAPALIGPAHGIQAATTRETPAASGGDVVGADAFEIAHQAAGVGVGEHHLLHVHDRLHEPRAYQGVAHVVHVQETVHVVV